MGLQTFALPVMSLIQDRLIFKPRQKGIEPLHDPVRYGLEGFRTQEIRSEDHTRLELWYTLPRDAHLPTVVFFHGNTGNLGDVGEPSHTDVFNRAYRISALKALQATGAGIVALSLRGYGRSSGKASESGFLRDLRALNAWILKRGIKPSQLIYFGESLGSANALLAAESLYRVEGVAPAMVATLAAFFSIPAKTAELYSFLPIAEARGRMRHRFECGRALASLPPKTFVLLMAPELDETTPKSHSYQLAETALSARLPHEIIELKGAGHISWSPEEVASLLLAFYNAHRS